jgi:hypothetical protein
MDQGNRRDGVEVVLGRRRDDVVATFGLGRRLRSEISQLIRVEVQHAGQLVDDADGRRDLTSLPTPHGR